MIIEMVFVGGSNLMKVRVGEDKKIYASSPKTGLSNFIPHTISKNGLKKAKEKKKYNENKLKEAEKELLEDEKWLQEHTQKEVMMEIKKEMAKSGFRMTRRTEI